MIEKIDYADQTIVHPVGLLAWFVLAALILLLPRSRAIVPVFVLACFVPPAQRVAIAGLDFTLLRLLLIVGWARFLFRREHQGLRLIALDRVVIAYAVVSSLANIALRGTASAVIYNLGAAFDVLTMYFLARVFLRSFPDLDSAIGGFIGIALAVSVPFVLERFVEPHRNLFAVFGGIDEITSAREGKVRAQGAFPHAIVAGCFWAALIPLILSRFWTHPDRRTLAAAGLAAALLVIFTTASSTPVAGAFVALATAACFPLRRHLRLVRWGAVFLLIGLEIAMEAPVWHLISRIDLVGGSTGWHRYHLIDQAIRRFPEWALIGTRSTDHWGHGLFDVTNQYVYEGVRGGVLGLGLFVASMCLAFRGVGRALRATERDRRARILAWMVGVSLFVHAAMFLAVSYFGQMYSLWYFTLAAAACLESRTAEARAPVAGARERRRVPPPERPSVLAPAGR